METVYTSDRRVWRKYLEDHFQTSREIWLVFPMKESGEKSLSYNDAVEEALCFGWIDSTIKHIDELHRAQRFTPRRQGSPYSRPNIERLIRMEACGMIHPAVRDSILPVIRTPFVFPEDILDALKQDDEVWKNYQRFSDPYKRIRIAYIDAARMRPEEFRKRLNSFIEKTRRKRLIKGYGGIDKYYRQRCGEERKMNGLTYITLRDCPELMDDAAVWFSRKWGVPEEAYRACMRAYLNKETEYGWYLCLDGKRIAGGLGVIENDFHERRDLSPNVCAVYTEEAYRGRGIAGVLLDTVVEDMRSKGITPLYLVTDHTGFYERYGWEFYCMTGNEDGQSRVYIHR